MKHSERGDTSGKLSIIAEYIKNQDSKYNMKNDNFEIRNLQAALAAIEPTGFQPLVIQLSVHGYIILLLLTTELNSKTQAVLNTRPTVTNEPEYFTATRKHPGKSHMLKRTMFCFAESFQKIHRSII